MKVQCCNNSPNFGMIKNIIYKGEFANPINKAKAEKVISAVKGLPSSLDFFKHNDADIILNAQCNRYVAIGGMNGFQKTLDLSLSILQKKKSKNIKEFIKNIFNPIEKITISTFFLNEISLSDKAVNDFIESFIQDNGMFTLGKQLKNAQI